jgi:flagellar hook-associated protein 1 FlgK
VDYSCGTSIPPLKSNLDYLATIQWKSDLNFEGKAQGSTSNDAYSLSHFYNSIKIEVSSDNEDVIAVKDVQDTVKQSIQTSYDNLTKVDRDEEMLNLITFQAAYTANAKIVTAIDDMLQTLLGMKR